MKRSIGVAALCLMISTLAGCATAPETENERTILEDQAGFVLGMMEKQDPNLPDFLQNAYAYAVFPTIGKGGLIAGGSYGHGVVYERGVMIGFADVTQATIGGQIGGQTYSELVVLEDKLAMDQFKFGKLTFETNLSAVALQKGTSRSVKYYHGVAAFVYGQGGLMAEATVGGQQFTYQPATRPSTVP